MGKMIIVGVMAFLGSWRVSAASRSKLEFVYQGAIAWLQGVKWDTCIAIAA